MAAQYTIKLTTAVVCAMQLDDVAMRKELGIEAGYKHLKRGAKITGTLDELSKLARHMTPKPLTVRDPSRLQRSEEALEVHRREARG